MDRNDTHDLEPAVEPDDVQASASDGAATVDGLLARYQAALRDPGRSSDDPIVAAQALVEIDDAREAYRAAGGTPGSHWSMPSRAEFIAARELLGQDVTERRAALDAEMSAARDALGLKRR